MSWAYCLKLGLPFDPDVECAHLALCHFMESYTYCGANLRAKLNCLCHICRGIWAHLRLVLEACVYAVTHSAAVSILCLGSGLPVRQSECCFVLDVDSELSTLTAAQSWRFVCVCPWLLSEVGFRSQAAGQRACVLCLRWLVLARRTVNFFPALHIWSFTTLTDCCLSEGCNQIACRLHQEIPKCV